MPKEQLQLSSLQTEILSKINEAYREFVELGDRATECVVAFTNKGREIGLELHTLRANTGRHVFEQLAFDMGDGEPRLPFKAEEVKLFSRLADRLPEPAGDMISAVSSLKDVLMLQGALPFPEGHGAQRLHDRDPIALIVHNVMEIQAVWNKELKHQVWKLSAERNQFLRDQLAPIVRIYELLAA
jgi:hypothetical protein